MSKAIRIHETGGPEVLRWEDVDVGVLQAGEVRLRQTAVGLNFIDTYHRRGLYPVDALPTVIGMEGAGVVEEIGENVHVFQVGDRVAYAGGPIGSYTEERRIPAARLVKLPDSIDSQHGAALMLKGLTTQYLVRRCYHVKPGDTILIHAAAGGMGLLVCQWAKHLGATVIGTVSTREKAELAASHGCDHPILYREEDFVERVRELTNGVGVPVVYDSVGRDTFDGSLDCQGVLTGRYDLLSPSPVTRCQIIRPVPKGTWPSPSSQHDHSRHSHRYQQDGHRQVARSVTCQLQDAADGP